MEEEIISFETATLAKEKGFPGDNKWAIPLFYEKNLSDRFVLSPNSSHVNDCYAPSQSLLQRWLREEHNIDVVLAPERYKDGVNYLVQAQKFDFNCNPEENENFCTKGSYWFNDNHEYPTYEDALEKGLFEGLKLIEND